MKRTFLIIFLVIFRLISFAQDTTRLSVLFLGDVMQHDSQIADAYDARTGTWDYRPCFQYIKPYIQAADLAIGNLEVTLGGKPYKGYPQFSAPDQLLTALTDAGIDVLVTANNHCVDRGRRGLERTVDLLDSVQMLHTGTFKSAGEREKTYPLMVDRMGFRLAILNYTYGTNGLPVRAPNIVNRLDTATIRRDLIKAETLRPDAIIVFTHWGKEYERLPSENQKQIAELCFKHGAQLVIGSHPHVLQPMEWRKKDNQLVAWSLGNFVSGQRKRYTDGGAMIRVELQKISFDDGSSFTAIDTAGYILEWVYRTRDSQRNYYVLPVPEAERNGLARIADDDSRAAFETFVSDSRDLLGRHNVNMEELKSAAEYVVGFNATDTVAVKKYLQRHTGIRHINDERYPAIRIGPFTLQDALHLHRRIQLDLPVERLMIEKK